MRPGEAAARTQPFSIRLSPHAFDTADVWGPTEAERANCRAQIRPLRNEGIFTPPGLEGTLGTPYIMRRRIFRSPSGYPCSAPPFGTLVAVNLTNGTVLWEKPLGTFAIPGGPAVPGSINLGGPITTASGLTFIGATLDRRVRAFETATGTELWSAELPAGARATPMTYVARNGRQYVVIAAAGGGLFGAGDAIIAFRLP